MCSPNRECCCILLLSLIGLGGSCLTHKAMDNPQFPTSLIKTSTKSTMSHISNPIATPSQLYQTTSSNTLPIELQDSIRFYTARLTQAAGILLRLPQDITAQANVLLFRYWLVDDLMAHEFSVRSNILSGMQFRG
jgi:hypothetical protein